MWAASNTALGGSGAPAAGTATGTTPLLAGKPVTRVFGQPLDPENGNAPITLIKLVQYLQKRGKNTPGLFRESKEDLPKEVEALRKGIIYEKEHFQVASYTNSPFTAAEVMRQFLAALPDPLLTCDLYDSFIIALTFTELEDRLDYWRLLLDALPPGFKATAEKTLSLLNLLHTHSTGQFPANGNYAHNLGPVFAPIFLRPRVPVSYMAHDAKMAADVVQNLIEHMPSLFDPAQRTTIHNTPRRPPTVPVSTSTRLASLPRSLRSSSPPSSPKVGAAASTTTLPSSSSFLPEHQYPKMPAIIKPSTPKRRRLSTITPRTDSPPRGTGAEERPSGVASPEEAAQPARETDATTAADAPAVDNEQATPVPAPAHEGEEDHKVSTPETASEGLQSPELSREPPVDSVTDEGDASDDTPEQSDEENGATNATHGTKDEDMRHNDGKELDGQVSRIERACEDITCHLYDEAMTFERALSTSKNLRQLCEDIVQFFNHMELQLPHGDVSDAEAIPDNEQDESKLLLVIAQIKHFISQAQADTQLLIDAHERTSDDSESRRRLVNFVQEIAARFETIAHPRRGTHNTTT